MHDLLPDATAVAALLKARKETVAVAESAAGGLITAALLAVPGASAYCRGGAVIYTRHVLLSLKGMNEEMLAGMRPATEAYALFQARAVRERFSADGGIGETGAAGNVKRCFPASRPDQFDEIADHALLRRPRACRRGVGQRHRPDAARGAAQPGAAPAAAGRPAAAHEAV
ncbi:MAG: CinA family protein [Betaproteobacteria bacterium]|nr:CinA family protein [Betaproteobacteria bacterium]